MTPQQIADEVAAAGRLFATGRMDEARQVCARILEASPDDADALHISGLIRFHDGFADDAVDLLVRAIEQRPGSADMLANLGHLQLQRGEYEAALDCLAAAQELAPDDLTLRLRLALALSRLGRDAEAVAAYREILARAPNHPAAHHDLAIHLQTCGRREEALAEFEHVLRLNPDDLATRATAIRLRQVLCQWEGSERLRAELIEPALGMSTAERRPQPFIVLGLPTPVAPAEFQIIATRFCRSQPALKAARRFQFQTPRPLDGRRLRVGYATSDFGNHPGGRILNALLPQHDRTTFEIFAYATVPDDGSAERRRNREAVEYFIDLSVADAASAARRINADGIDILIDANGHSTGNRLDVFALRPSPLQATWLGFPGTLGMETIDYLIADEVVAPAVEQPYYNERLVHLPDSYYAVPPLPAAAVPSRHKLGLPEHGFVFANFGASFKIEPQVFDVWMRLLSDVGGSVLWLWVENDAAKTNLRREAAARGVEPDRLVFAPSVPSVEHVARLPVADLFLDTFYYGAHSTSAEALSAGLPVVTCIGPRFSGRVAASQLRAAGLPDLVASTPADYEALALRLARDPAALATIRQRLKAAHATAAMFNPARFAMHFEAALRQMWENYAAGNPPRPISVKPT